MSIAVIDIGKTDAKVLLVSEAGETLAERRRPNVVRPGPPYPHHDADALWDFALDALSGIAAEARAIVPVAHGACAALVDTDGGLALPVLDYEHPGPDETRGTIAPPPFAETGTPPMPGGLNLWAQLCFLRARAPDGFARTRRLLLWPQWWAFRLSGVAASEVTSLACHSGIWDVHAARPSSLARREGWDALIPPLRRAWDVLGPVRPEVAARTGLDPATPVLCGIHDSNASLMSYLDRGPCAVVGTGTWIVPMALGNAVPDLSGVEGALLNVSADGRIVPTAPFMGGRDRDRAMRRGTAARAADSEAARRTARRLDRIGARGPIHVEGPFAASDTFRDVLSATTGRPVVRVGGGVGVGGGAGTTRGAALLARRAGVAAPLGAGGGRA